MTLALVITDRKTKQLERLLKQRLPKVDIQIWPHIRRPRDIVFAVLWKQPKGLLSDFNQLKHAVSLGAGIDFIQQDPDLPKGVQVGRIVTNYLKKQMSQYVLAYILNDYRELTTYSQQQQSQLWQINALIDKPQVGFLGLGKTAKFVATLCKKMGFKVVAYTKESKNKKVSCYHGESGLKKVMRTSHYIVNLLPLNESTKHLLNYKRFCYCNNKPLFIQVGRGKQLVEKDLIKALDKGVLKGAVLDVFDLEPLPKEHVFWKRKDILITPHNAARSDVKQSVNEIVKQFKQANLH